MTTVDSGGEAYISIAMSTTSASTSTTSKNANGSTSSADISSPFEGLEDVQLQRFVGIADMRKIVKARSDELEEGGSDQYLIFQPVTSDDLAASVAA